ITTPTPRLSTVVPDVPPALDQLIADMMSHDPAGRVQSMRDVRERLDEIYPELRGPSVKLRSLPPASSSPNLDRYVVHASAGPMNPTIPGTSARVSIPKNNSGRSVLIVAGIAALIGAGVGLVSLRHRSETPTAPAVVAPATPPQPSIPPPPTPSASAPPPPAASVLPPAPTAVSSVPAVGAGRGGAPPRPAKPKDQVGSAGISSQF
ncbi:MAG TPA: hypothetical protein VMI75_25275, partial [Polyangiaceae bacterium]|nr:hypothetical protein [Polyangiaceae bacterium]